jgi:TonB family protein
MGLSTGGSVESIIMSEAWKQWEGTVVDSRFVLGDFQGGSGHSAVFLTTDGASRRAAIKFVEANPITAQQQLSRWERASQLSHPHLIRLLHWGRCQLGKSSMLYAVTEFADENLSQILPTRALTPSETEYMLRSALEVLAYLHNAGLAHSAVKPSNLMAVGDDLRLSSDTICAIGEKRISPREASAYDAPELATSGASPAADMWSLGMSVVEALTQRPAPGPAIRQTDPAVPESLPQPFLEIARECTRLDPQRRWTASDVAARLLPAAASPPRKTMARSAYALAAIILIAVLAGLAGTRFLHHGSAKVASSSQPNHGTAPSDPGAPGPPDTPATSKTPATTDRHPLNSSDRESASASGHSATKATRPSGSGAIPGAVAEKVMPSVSQRSRSTITGKVRVGVKVAVDPSGRVVNASLTSPGPSRYFANMALQSARKWTFTPPRMAEQAVPSQWILKFAFARSGVEAQSQQVSP